MPKEKAKVKHWSYREDFQYYCFLLLHFNMISKNKKESKIYVQMSKYIKHKNPTQCRTHHEKKIGELRLENSENAEIQNLHNFYRQNYISRLLDIGHLKKELLYFIKKTEDENDTKKQKKIQKGQLRNYRENIDTIIQELNFEVIQGETEKSLIEVSGFDTDEKESRIKIVPELGVQIFKNDSFFLDEFYYGNQSSELKY